MNDRLIAARLRPAALGVVAACAVVTGVLGVHYANTSHPGRIDRALDQRIKRRLAEHHHLLEHLVDLGNPATVATLVLFLALLCALRRKWRGAILSVLGTGVAVVLTEVVLKPIIDRHIGLALSFPSGHTTGAFAVAITAVVLLFEGRGLRNPLRVVLIVLSIVLAGGVAAAVVALGHHYATDTVGGFCVALGSVLGVAVLIDVVAERNPQLPAIVRKRS